MAPKDEKKSYEDPLDYVPLGFKDSPWTKNQRETAEQNRSKWADAGLMIDPGPAGRGTSGSSTASGWTPPQPGQFTVTPYDVQAEASNQPNNYVDPNLLTPTKLDIYGKPLPPEQTQPLPTGVNMEQLADLAPGSTELSTRRADAQDKMQTPRDFVNANVAELSQDQTILDKGMSFLGGLFNYEDESDLQVLGMNISAVESTWDNAMRYLIGGRNVLDSGITALISAMPGGVPTYEWGQITDNHSLWEVFHGDIGLKENVGPSPMQTAITSVGIEAARIRGGEARLSDILLFLSPATAPFVIAGIAAESSPLQQPGFNLLDPEQRLKAFSSGGWEQWMSGIGDAGVQVASPSIGATAIFGVLMKGALGVRKGRLFAATVDKGTADGFDAFMRAQAPEGVDPADFALSVQNHSIPTRRRYAQRLERAPLAAQYKVAEDVAEADDFWKALDDRGGLAGRNVDEVKQEYLDSRAIADAADPERVLNDAEKANMDRMRRIDASFDLWQQKEISDAARRAGDDVPDLVKEFEYTKSSDELGIKNPIARLMNDILQTRDGRKVLTVEQIAQRVELRANSNRMAIANLLYNIRDPFTLTAALQAMHGSARGKELLAAMAPSILDDLSTHMMTIARANHLAEPSQVDAVRLMLDNSAAALVRQREALLRRYPHAEVIPEDVGRRVRDLDASLDQVREIKRYFDGDIDSIDVVDPASPFFNAEWAERVINDLFIRAEIIDSLTGDGALVKAGMNVQKPTAMMIMKDNWYARAVAKRRERNARARYEYQMDQGTGLLPRRVWKEVKTGESLEIVRKWEFGWKASPFNTPTWKRAMRGWMWLGTETPAGQITLKGTGAIGSERELEATLSLDMYRGAAIMVDYGDGPKAVGGMERRAELMSWWAQAQRDPSIDKLSVLKRIEDAIGEDMMRVYGLANHKDKFLEMMNMASRRRSKTLDFARRTGTMINKKGEIDYIPYLQHHLANVHIMQNWHFLESKLQRNALAMGGPGVAGPTRKFRNGMGVAGDIAVNLDNIFQEFWRPAVLLRLSYPQRNTFEGISRAVAFYGSLAPIAWPLVATAKGTMNVARKVGTRSGKTAKFLEKVANSKEYMDARASVGRAQQEHDRLAAAYPQAVTFDQFERWRNADSNVVAVDSPIPPENTVVRWVMNDDPEKDGMYRWMSEEEWSDALSDARLRVEAAEEILAPMKKVLDEAAGNSRFGRWRKKNIEAAEKDLENSCQAAMAAKLAMTAGPGGIAGADAAMRAVRSEQIAAERLRTLKYDAPGAVRMWREQAGRQTRIGSGTSYGPDGGLYPDAFADEYALMNAQAASSDLSRKTTLAAFGDVWSNWFLQSTVMHNVDIPYNPVDPSDWINGMAQQIEQWVYNPLVRAILEGSDTIDPETAFRWMLDTPEGQEFAITMRFLQGTDFEVGDLTRYLPVDDTRIPGAAGPRSKVFTQVKEYAGRDPDSARFAPDSDFKNGEVRVTHMAKPYRDPLTGRMEYEELIDESQAYAYLVANDMIAQFQSAPEFLDLLRKRAREVEAGSSRPVTASDVRDVLRTLTPLQRERLGNVIGSRAIAEGTKDVVDMYKNLVNRLFRIIGTIPEDSLVRGPFYNKRFKQVRNALIEEYWLNTDPSMLGRVRRGGFSKGGKSLPDDIEHPQFQIPKDELDNIMAIAHRQALMDTKEYLYTIERRTNLGKYGEHIWPFISAQQNTVTAVGKILYKNPWIAPAAARLWYMPERMGYTDENGDFIMPMPYEWVQGLLEDAVDIPIIGGVLSGDAMITMPQNGLNVWAPDTGFLGVVPRPGGLVPVVASTAMKAGMFPAEPPDAVKSILGEEAAGEQWQLVKDYIFGEGFTYSADNPLFQMLPAWGKRVVQAFDENSKAYVYQYALTWAHETSRAISGEREDWPKADEIHKRTTNTMWFYVLGNQGVPTPLTPYPILSRPQVTNPTVDILNEIYMNYQNAMGKRKDNGEYLIEPGEAMRTFSRDFGYDLLEVALATTNVSENMGGAKVTAATVADIKAYAPQIRELMEGGLAASGDMRVLDILINNSNGQGYEYSIEANRYLGLETIPGASDLWREQNSGPEAAAQTEADVGWVQYRQFMDDMESRMQSAGVKSFESKAGQSYKNQKIVFLTNLAKSYPAWRIDYLDGAERGLPAALDVITKVATDEAIQARMIQNGQEQLAANFREYAYYRQQTAQALAEVADNDYQRQEILAMWDQIRKELNDRDLRWAEISNRWLDADEAPGMQYDTELVAALKEM